MLLECSIVDTCTCLRCPSPLELGIPPIFKDVIFIGKNDIVYIFSSGVMTTTTTPTTTITTSKTYDFASLHTKRVGKVSFKFHYTFPSLNCPLNSFRMEELFLPSFSPPPPLISSPTHLNSNKLYKVIHLINKQETPQEQQLIFLSKLLKSYRNSLIQLDSPSHYLFPRLNISTDKIVESALQLSLDELNSLIIRNDSLSNIISSNLFSLIIRTPESKKKKVKEKQGGGEEEGEHSIFEKFIPFLKKKILHKKESYSAVQYFFNKEAEPMRSYCFWSE